MLGGLLMGKVVDKISSRAGVILNVLLIIVACLLAIWQIQRNQFDTVSYLFTFAWGFQDGAVNTHSFQMMGFEFNTSSDPFALFNGL